MLVSCEEMRRLEEAAFARGIRAGELMEEAGRGLAEIVRQFFPMPGHCVAFCGKGNNAGDALVALKYLRQWGWEVSAALAFEVERFGELPAWHYHEVQPARFSGQVRAGVPLVALDGLLGVGTKGEPREPVAGLIASLNQLRQTKAAWVLAIDLPSGLDGDTGEPAKACVEADLTATIGLAKRGLVADAAANHVGRLALVSLKDLPPDAGLPYQGELSVAAELRDWLPPRHFDSHKGKFGRVGIMAGSEKFPGAARLCSAAVVKGGAGLVTLFVKPEMHAALSTSCLPEVMVKVVKNYRDVLDERLDVLAIGPGLSTAAVSEVATVVQRAKQPMVVDADAITIVAQDSSLLKYCDGPRLLTPHPGEMERLLPQRGRTRREWLEEFLARYPVTLVLKGARTIVGGASSRRFYNTTGHPGMGTGGMGDVLTGVCAALAAQVDEHDLLRAAALGTWVCGRAAERAVYAPGGSQESLSASDVLNNLGAAFQDLRLGVY